ncbi:MAG: hypothetical protein WA971_06350, partial [Microbacterium sp.]
MSADAARIGILLDGPPGDGSFVDAAVSAADRLRTRGIAVDVRVSPAEPDPRWKAVLCHGSAHHDWVLAHQKGPQRIVFTDRPDDHPLFTESTLVDWAWDEGATRLARAALAAVAPGAVLAVVAGPP